MTDSVEILITGGTIVDGTGAPGRAGHAWSSRATGCASSPAGAPLPEHAARDDRRDGQGRRPGVHRPAQPRRPRDPRRAASRAQGPPGRHDRDRRGRRQRLRAVRAARGPRGVRPSSMPGSTAIRPSTTTGARSPSTSPATTGRSASTSARSSATASSGSAPSAGTTTRPTTGPSTGCGRSCATRCRRARSASAPGLDYPPGSFATTEELAALDREAAATAGSITATSATRSATASSIRSARRSRSAGAPRRRRTSPTSTTARPTRAGRTSCCALVDDARAEGLDVTFDSYPSEWASTRLLIQLPQWIQAGGPGPLKERLADRARARPRSATEIRPRGAAYTSPAGWADVRLGNFRRPDLLRWESRPSPT